MVIIFLSWSLQIISLFIIISIQIKKTTRELSTVYWLCCMLFPNCWVWLRLEGKQLSCKILILNNALSKTTGITIFLIKDTVQLLLFLVLLWHLKKGGRKGRKKERKKGGKDKIKTQKHWLKTYFVSGKRSINLYFVHLTIQQYWENHCYWHLPHEKWPDTG